MSDPEIQQIQAENQRLRQALSMVVLPLHMSLSYHEMAGDVIPDDQVVFSFMGGGGSAQVRAGDVRAAVAALNGDAGVDGGDDGRHR